MADSAKTDQVAKPAANAADTREPIPLFTVRTCVFWGLQTMEPSWSATKHALNVAQLRISSLCSAKQQSDAQHGQQIQVAAPLLLTTHAYLHLFCNCVSETLILTVLDSLKRADCSTQTAT